MALANLHSDQLSLSTLIGCNINEAGVAGLLTNTTVAAADSNSGLQAAVTAASVHADIVPMKTRINVAIQAGLTDGTLTDAAILSLTTIAQVVALTNEQAGTNIGLYLE